MAAGKSAPKRAGDGRIGMRMAGPLSPGRRAGRNYAAIRPAREPARGAAHANRSLSAAARRVETVMIGFGPTWIDRQTSWRDEWQETW
ncbi:protein of unknown function [Burkholderia multivorans]